MIFNKALIHFIISLEISPIVDIISLLLIILLLMPNLNLEKSGLV